MKRTNTQTLSDILKDFFEDNPIVAQKLAENRLIKAWEKVTGKAVSRYTESLYIKNQTLYIRLSSAVLRNELSLCRSDLIIKLNEEAGTKVINQIVLLN